ncbi:drug/metabolite transporter (DMT)-like permease [Microbacterium sp. SORGH_AS 1204]|uniref:DMT family transporter n=1 Tax=Microbacterium sp. SORGH_AS_1204 TaxID=3041785 RepID=UPI0027916E17|nr:DMT family transporter [Microbacterium sp. SORGH_AS_1204]MDQ1137772.1 drug/metabolite transporter (DMT)-like permease [Microbacterium sp. SORGH_AS_1204]
MTQTTPLITGIPSPRNPRTRASVLLALAMAGWGTIGLFSIQAGTDAITTTAWRCVFGAATLLVLSLATRSFQMSIWTRRAVILTVPGGLALVANWAFLFFSFSQTTITITTVAYHFEPFFLVALGAIASRTAPRRGDVAWLLAAFGGLLLATQFVGARGIQPLDAAQLLGIGAALAAGALYAVATFAAQHTSGIRPYPMTLIQCVVGAVILLPFAHSLDWSGSSWGWIAVMGIVHTGLLYSILYSTARVLSTITLAALSFVNPAVAVFVDVMVYGRLPDALQLVGIAIIAAATLAMTLRNR